MARRNPIIEFKPHPRHHVRLHWADGDVSETVVSGTKESVEQYYVGKVFNRGYGGEDYLVRCVRVEFVAEAAQNPRKRRNPETVMRAEYSPVNQAWFVLWHGNPIEMGGQMAFSTKGELEAVMRSHGLRFQSRSSGQSLNIVPDVAR